MAPLTNGLNLRKIGLRRDVTAILLLFTWAKRIIADLLGDPEQTHRWKMFNAYDNPLNSVNNINYGNNHLRRRPILQRFNPLVKGTNCAVDEYISIFCIQFSEQLTVRWV